LLPHGVITFSNVEVAASEVLPGDAYVEAIKPFRTLEDLFLRAALLSCLLGAGLRRRASEAALETLLFEIVALRALASLDPTEPTLHLALAGALRSSTQLLTTTQTEITTRLSESLRAAWQRAPGFLEIAATARERRRRRAWDSLLEDATS
jgi:hypothetical protein